MHDGLQDGALGGLCVTELSSLSSLTCRDGLAMGDARVHCFGFFFSLGCINAPCMRSLMVPRRAVVYFIVCSCVGSVCA